MQFGLVGIVFVLGLFTNIKTLQYWCPQHRSTTEPIVAKRCGGVVLSVGHARVRCLCLSTLSAVATVSWFGGYGCLCHARAGGRGVVGLRYMRLRIWLCIHGAWQRMQEGGQQWPFRVLTLVW